MEDHRGGRSADSGGLNAGWLEVSSLGALPVISSRQGREPRGLGVVTDEPTLSAAGLIQTDEQRWAIEQCWKDAKPRLGLGQYQNRPCRAAVTHRHLVCCAEVLLTHLRITRDGVQGQQTRENAVGRSVGAAQEALRCLLWDDWVAYLTEEHHDASVLAELERLRVALIEQKSVNLSIILYSALPHQSFEVLGRTITALGGALAMYIGKLIYLKATGLRGNIRESP